MKNGTLQELGTQFVSDEE